MKIKLLTNPWQRSWGATLNSRLGDTVLVFTYPHSAARLFHTFFCPPLRIIALDREKVVYDQTVSPGHFVRIPPSRIIIECDPASIIPPLDTFLDLSNITPGDVAAWNESVSIDRLLLSILLHAVADMRRVHEAHHRSGTVKAEVLQERFSVSERGRIVNSAGYIQDFAGEYPIPQAVLRLARQVVKLEQPYLDDLLAASVGGVSWKNSFPNACLRCQRPASWRMVIAPPETLVIEEAWRYQRPENAVPLCRKCISVLNWQTEPTRRYNLALGVWGARFEAFSRWHQARIGGRLPADWCRQQYPLWPKQLGGATWETGSGALEHADPRPPNASLCTETHHAALLRGLEKKGRPIHSPDQYLVH